MILSTTLSAQDFSALFPLKKAQEYMDAYQYQEATPLLQQSLEENSATIQIYWLLGRYLQDYARYRVSQLKEHIHFSVDKL